MNHTPGPWEFSHVDGEFGHVITIAEGELAEAFSETVGTDQAIANARLISAAPALAKVWDLVPDDIKQSIFDILHNPSTEWVEQAIKTVTP